MQNQKTERVLLQIFNKANDKPVYNIVISTTAPDEIIQKWLETMSDAVGLIYTFFEVVRDMNEVDQMKFFQVLADKPAETIENMKEGFEKYSYIQLKKF